MEHMKVVQSQFDDVLSVFQECGRWGCGIAGRWVSKDDPTSLIDSLYPLSFWSTTPLIVNLKSSFL